MRRPLIDRLRRDGSRRDRRLRPALIDNSFWLENRTLLSTVTVNTSNDQLDYASTVTVGGLTGTISLRDAVEAATNTAGATTIVLPAGNYNLTHPTVFPAGQSAGGDDVPNVTDELIVGNIAGQSITIQAASGAAAGSVVIDQIQSSLRIFNADPAQLGNIAFNLTNVTLEGAENVNEAFGGGAILAGGPGTNTGPFDSLSLTNCIVQGNSTSDQIGGAISYGGGGNLTVSGSTFTNNFASGSSMNGEAGGAIAYDNSEPGTLTITNSTFTNNRISGTGPGSLGGAVSFAGASGSITGSTFAGNNAGQADGRGGAVEVDGSASTTFTIAGDTFTDNAAGTGTSGVAASGVGGALDIENDGTTNISDSTFVGNSTGTLRPAGSASYAATGGAIETFGGTIGITTSRFFGNTSSSGTAIANSGGAVTATNDWWGANAFPNAAGTDTVVVNPGPDVNPGGTISIPSRLALALVPSPATIGTNATSTLTAEIVSATATTTGTTPITGTALEGLAVTFAPGTLGSVSPTSAQIVNGVATSTFTAGSTSGTTHPTVRLDNGTKQTAITIVGAPTANSSSVNVAFDTAKAITLTGSDPNTPPLSLTYTVTTAPTHGTLSGTAPNLTYTPAAGYHGSDSFQFTVNNGFDTSSAATVSLTVATGVPTANPQSDNVAFNTAKAIALTATDPDVPALTLTYTVTAGPTHGTLSGTAPNLTYTPAAGYHGADSFQFTASNGTNTSSPAAVSLTVASGTPTANPQSDSLASDSSKAITLTGSDPDSPPLSLTYTVTTGPAHGTLSGTAPNLVYTPTAGYSGPDSFQFTVNNGTNTSSPAAVSLNVVQNTATVSGTVGVSWGTSGSATLLTNADGLRLLASGRNTDLPFLGINKLTITLSQAESLSPSDVTVTGVNIANYGPVTISGSGTSYTITLAHPIDAADRVTVTIANANIATFTRRLDVLPGDFNDDGTVNGTDATLVRNEYLGLGGATPTIFGDIDGNGVVDVNDYNVVRRLLGTRLP